MLGRGAVCLAVLGGLIWSGCSGSDDDTDSVPDHEKCVGTEMAWAIGTSMASEAGTFKVTIESATPDPPAKGTNDWVLKVTDASGAALDDVTFDDALTYQHVHKHEGAAKPTVTAQGKDGLYDAKGWDVVHVGSWEFRMTLTQGGKTDKATFHFCVGGESDGDAHEGHGH